MKHGLQARLRERFNQDSGATSFTEVFQYSWPNEKPFEDVWREWVKKVSKKIWHQNGGEEAPLNIRPSVNAHHKEGFRQGL